MSANDASQSRAGPNRRAVAAWCLYDWANSAYPTVVVTFVFAAYYTATLAPDPETGTALWGRALALSGLGVAVLAPVLGALADQAGRRKPWIGGFTVVAVACAAALWWIRPDPAYGLAALVLVALGNAAFEFGQVFYNAMLPDLVPRGWLGRVSGWAWALGYAGGLACLVLTLVLFVREETAPFALDTGAAAHVRITGPFVGLWFLLFAVPLFLLTPDRAGRRVRPAVAVRSGLATLWHTLCRLPRYRGIGRFLLARMIYTDGLNTLFAFGGVYAAGTFAMTFEDILVFGILLNIAAGAGAFGFAWLDDRIGARRTVILALLGLIAAGAAVLAVESKLWFTVLGCVIGLFIGPAQSASRSMMARLAPAEIRTELFGLYALSGKATAFVGPAAVGWVTLWAGSQRAGMATILAFFVLGLIVLWPLAEPAGPEPAPADRA
ncbi:MAG: MFS transporter [Alphaproteobacteria bacterium]|nr:MAG: MFS transporter [Alphaproteobacteria bacterium]